jgi:GDP-L-fucose synthase
MSFDLTDKKVLVTGGAGFLGKHVVAELERLGVKDIFVPRRSDYDLTNMQAVFAMYSFMRPDVVIHLAAEVGGIGANQDNPGRYFYANTAMGLNLIELARVFMVQRFVFVGTVCSYPKHCPTPFCEDDIWNGYPEETNAPYGIAKRAIMEMLSAYHKQYGMASACLVPANLYGLGDNFDTRTSHVIPALIRKFVGAQESVTLWGTGEATREFLHVTDAARAVVLAAEKISDPAPINLGTGEEIRIADLAQKIATLCDFQGEVVFDSTKPDGQPRRTLDYTRAKTLLDWTPQVDFDAGLQEVIHAYQSGNPSEV